MTLPRIRGRYPILAAALEEMFEDWALAKKNANALARKADPPSGGTLSRARTVFDAYLSPLEQPRARQYKTDLTGMSQVSFVSRSSGPCYLFGYTGASTEFAPAFDPVTDSDGIQIVAESSGGGPNWMELAEVWRTPVRLAVSTEPEAVGVNPDAWDGPFSVALQARP